MVGRVPNFDKQLFNTLRTKSEGGAAAKSAFGQPDHLFDKVINATTHEFFFHLSLNLLDCNTAQA